MTKNTVTARTYPGGAAAASKAYTVKKEVDSSTITSGTTDVNGQFTYNANGSAGPWRWEVTDSTPTTPVTRKGSSKSTGSGGSYALAEVPMVLRAFGNGVIAGYLNALAVSIGGVAGHLTIATGAAIAKGIIGNFESSTDYTVTTARDATNPKACYCVIETTGIGQTEEGKVVIKDVCGAAAASPSLPSLTQTEATYQYPLASFRLPVAGALTTLADLRTYIGTRNPTVSSIARRTDPAVSATTTSTTGADVTFTSGSTTPTLVSGVVYDIEARAFLLVKVTAGQTVSIAPYINGTGNIATYVSSDASSDYQGIANVSTLSEVTGAGATITCGLRIKVSGGTGTYLTGHLLVIARPRS